MNKTKIEWCDYTWNVVTGCYHGCDYCYARRIAERFGGNDKAANCAICGDCPKDICLKCDDYIQMSKIHELDWPTRIFYPKKRVVSYPYEFEPTFYEYKLNEPKKLKKPSKIFVCSMGDLFGTWVPVWWIQRILDVIEECPQHIFMFLTKNPHGYSDISIADRIKKSKNIWIGTTITSEKDSVRHIEMPVSSKKFLSIEPLLGSIYITYLEDYQWVILGAQTGPGAIKPKEEWVENIVNQCRNEKVPIFMKNNLKSIWNDDLIQEFPKERYFCEL